MVSISVGIPVRNGEKYLKQAIESIINQSIKDIEIIISDNNSSDRTKKICEKYAKIDKRIKYLRFQNNIGAAANFNRVFEISNGKYFKWAAHDDIIKPEFLEKCFKILEKDRLNALCFSRVKIINQYDEEIEEYPNLFTKINSPNKVQRFSDLVKIQHDCYEIFGLIRSEKLRKTKLIGNYIGSDRNLLAELSLLGKFIIIPEFMFHSRQHGQRSVSIKYHDRSGWYDPILTNKIVFPYWRNLFEYFKSIFKQNCSLCEKIRCQIIVIRWAATIWRNFGGDVKLFVKKKIEETNHNLKKFILIITAVRKKLI